MKQIIHTSKAPAALGPYSQAVTCNGMVYCSGQIGILPDSGAFAGDTTEAQTRQVMINLGEVLVKAGSGFGNVVKCSIFLADMDDFPIVNEIYGSYFKSEPPARETVAVKTLPKNARVEISCVAYV